MSPPLNVPCPYLLLFLIRRQNGAFSLVSKKANPCGRSRMDGKHFGGG